MFQKDDNTKILLKDAMKIVNKYKSLLRTIRCEYYLKSFNTSLLANTT